MAITLTRKGFGHVDGKQYIDYDIEADNGDAVDIDVQTEIGLWQVDEVWVQPDAAGTVYALVAETFPVYRGGTDITFDPSAAGTFRVRFVGSGG